MYRKHPNGTIEIVGDLEMNIPPVGTVFNVITGEWESRPVYSRSDKANEQFWERVKFPKNFKQRTRDEEEKRRVDPSFVDAELEEFRKQEWDRRLNGFWLMVDGIATYLTGLNYYYLSYFYIGAEGEGYPKYWESDRLWFYFYEYCFYDPNCFGFIYLVKRRAGKTSKASCAMLEYVSCLPNKNGGIQSKTNEDAKNVVYLASIVNAFKRLPSFFKPVYDTSAGTTPKRQLAFEATSDRSKSAKDVDYDDQLSSFITYANSKETAYDGTKLNFYIGDEVFKTENVDIRERHRVNKFCCTDYNGNPLGIMVYTSTCEEIQGQIQDYITFWKNSDQNRKDKKTGQTVTGLYRLFVPSDELIDRDEKFGSCDKEKNRETILARRDMVKDNRIELNSLVRKEPLTIEEAFRSAVNNCLFNSIKLTTRLDFLNFAPEEELYETGFFRWKDNVKFSSVIWVPDRNGLFKVKKGCLLKEEEANNVDLVGGSYVPRNQHKFDIGLDPADHHSQEINDQRQKSDVAFYLYCKFDVNRPELASTPIVEYCHRRDKPTDTYEDVLLCAWFWGASIFFENQKQGIRHWLDEHKCSKFLLWLPGSKSPGIPSSPQTKQAGAEYVEEFVEEYIDNVNFPLLILDLLNFQIEKTREYDRAMAFMWTLMGANRIKLKAVSSGVNDMSTLFKKHKIFSR